MRNDNYVTLFVIMASCVSALAQQRAFVREKRFETARLIRDMGSLTAVAASGQYPAGVQLITFRSLLARKEITSNFRGLAFLNSWYLMVPVTSIGWAFTYRIFKAAYQVATSKDEGSPLWPLVCERIAAWKPFINPSGAVPNGLVATYNSWQAIFPFAVKNIDQLTPRALRMWLVCYGLDKYVHNGFARDGQSGTGWEQDKRAAKLLRAYRAHMRYTRKGCRIGRRQEEEDEEDDEEAAGTADDPILIGSGLGDADEPIEIDDEPEPAPLPPPPQPQPPAASLRKKNLRINRKRRVVEDEEAAPAAAAAAVPQHEVIDVLDSDEEEERAQRTIAKIKELGALGQKRRREAELARRAAARPRRPVPEPIEPPSPPQPPSSPYVTYEDEDYNERLRQLFPNYQFKRPWE